MLMEYFFNPAENREGAVANLKRMMRVSLRLFLVLLTLACLWLGKLSIDARRQQAAVEWITKIGGDVVYDWQVDPQTNKALNKVHPAPAWLRTAWGDHCFQTVIGVSLTGAAVGNDYATLTELPEVRSLRLAGMKITDLAPLARMKNLEMLILDDNEIVDLGPLAGLQHLKTLDLDDNKIADLTPLGSLDRLETLIASNNQVSDLTPIGRLPNLIALDLSYNPIVDLRPLSWLPRIETIHLAGGQFEDCSPLLELPTLQYADLKGNPGVSDEEDRKLQEYLGRVRE